MKKTLAVVIFVLYSQVILCNQTEAGIINGWAGKDCGTLGNSSGVICISDVQFKLTHESNDVYSCPDRTWCANHPSICINRDGPACIKLPENLCGICLPNVTSICTAQNQYASCVNEMPHESWKIYCPPTEPYCTIDLDYNGLPVAVCTNIKEKAICSEEAVPPTEQPTTPSPTCPPGPTCRPPSTCPPPTSPTEPPPEQPEYCKPHKPHPECEEDPNIHISVKITLGN